MVAEILPFSLLVMTNGVIHLCEFRSVGSPPSFWRSIPMLKCLEFVTILAAAALFCFFLLSRGNLLGLVGIAVLAVLADVVIRNVCFHLSVHRFCETTGHARSCPHRYQLLQCASSAKCGDCDGAARLLRHTGHIPVRSQRPPARRKRRTKKVLTHNVW